MFGLPKKFFLYLLRAAGVLLFHFAGILFQRALASDVIIGFIMGYYLTSLVKFFRKIKVSNLFFFLRL